MPGPTPRYPDRDRLKVEILGRLATGETLVEACGSAGMPSVACVQVWRRSDAGFAAGLAAARAMGAEARRDRGRAFDEGVARAFLARLAAGEQVAALLDRPGMPSQRAYAHWRRTEAGFGEALEQLRLERYARRSGGGHGRWRGWDEAVADRITLAVMRGAVLRRLLASDPALPSLAVVERWRREAPAWDGALRAAMTAGRRAREAAGQGRGLWRPELEEEILLRIVEGGSLRSIGRDPQMPSARTLYAWCAKRPDFEAEVLEACRWREMAINERMLGAARRDRPVDLAQARREVRALKWRAIRLSKQPGWKRRRAAEANAEA